MELDIFQVNKYRIIQILFIVHLIINGCWTSRPPPNKIVEIKTTCTRDLFHVGVHLQKSFKGIIFARDFTDECRSKGNHTKSIELTLPIAGCGVRSELRHNGAYELSVRLILQMDEKLRQSADVETVARCTLPDSMMSTNISVADSKKTNRNGRMHHNASHSQRVRVWLELGGNNGAGAVEVGQPTTLAVRAVLPGNVGVRIIDCAALDGLGESSQKLIDERGCPIDEQVMPSLFIRSRPIDEGWSKPHEDDIVEKLFTATFPAFKFPDRERLHVSCGVQLCKGQCTRVNCKSDENFLFDASKQLARVEVFNSLAVTAPQIELDRLRTSDGHNVTIDEIQPKVRRLHGDGILCMSTLKLALAFCTLGLIFLIAVIVSISCLLRSKLRHSRGSLLAATSTSVFSSSSPSQSRFGSKLMMPYGGSLPYGRVY